MIGLIWVFVQEIALSMVGKVALKHVGERLATRMVVHGLNKLKDKVDNDVAKETVDDIVDSLKGKRLKVIDGNV